jgi:hypothetical protein
MSAIVVSCHLLNPNPGCGSIFFSNLIQISGDKKAAGILSYEIKKEMEKNIVLGNIFIREL